MFITSIPVGTTVFFNGQAVKFLEADDRYVKVRIVPLAGPGTSVKVDRKPEKREVHLSWPAPQE